MPDTLPLFPLGTVLLPGLVLPLHVFEERYRALVRDLLDGPEGAPRRFGVVAIRSGTEVGAGAARTLHDVGCAAEVRRVEELPDGRFLLVTVGGRRFALRDVDDAARPYAVGRVDWLGEDAGGTDDPPGEPLLASVRRAYAAYAAALAAARGEPAPDVELPDDPVALSYLVAARLVVDLGDTQRLLAEPDAGARLRAERALLERELVLLRQVAAIPSRDPGRVPPSLN